MIRYPIAIIVAASVTFGLFYVMYRLIAEPNTDLGDAKGGRVIEFVRLKRDESVQEKERKLPEKQEPDEPPPPPDLNLSQNNDVNPNAQGIASDFQFDVDMGTGGPGAIAAASDGEEMPLVRVPPQYPLRAEEQQIEGWVRIEFTITQTGTIKNPKVIEYHPTTIFNRAALKAVRRWKYNPKIVNGKPVERTKQIKLTFALPKNA